MSKTNEDVAPDELKELTCGLIMPISALDGYSADHWADVKAIISDVVESLESPRFKLLMVSDADEVGVIQKRIVQNVATLPLIVCDVSGKNANVMFELGLRLAFDKPTVIVKDDQTSYPFDTSVIEHVGYPRDLRFAKIVDFKKRLSDKLSSTYNASMNDPHHSTFLKSFGSFKVPVLAQTETTPEKLILEMLTDVQRDMQLIKARDRDRSVHSPGIQLDLSDADLRSKFLRHIVRSYCERHNIVISNPDSANVTLMRKIIIFGLERYPMLSPISRTELQSAMAEVKASD